MEILWHQLGWQTQLARSIGHCCSWTQQQRAGPGPIEPDQTAWSIDALTQDTNWLLVQERAPLAQSDILEHIIASQRGTFLGACHNHSSRLFWNASHMPADDLSPQFWYQRRVESPLPLTPSNIGDRRTSVIRHHRKGTSHLLHSWLLIECPSNAIWFQESGLLPGAIHLVADYLLPLRWMELAWH